jgi:hypothetical protein
MQAHAHRPARVHARDARACATAVAVAIIA